MSQFIYLNILEIGGFRKMEQFNKLIEVFGEVLEKSIDYHIAYVYHIGYVSVIGTWKTVQGECRPIVWIDEIFQTPTEMAESFLRNWRWQWLLKNRELISPRDYNDITELDIYIPNDLKVEYKKELQNWEDIINKILNKSK